MESKKLLLYHWMVCAGFIRRTNNNDTANVWRHILFRILYGNWGWACGKMDALIIIIAVVVDTMLLLAHNVHVY